MRAPRLGKICDGFSMVRDLSNLGDTAVATRRIRRVAIPPLEALDILARTMAPDSEHESPIGHHPRLTDRDETIFLLHTAAEIEHALLVQYLYAMYALKSDDELSDPQQQAFVTAWCDTLRQIALEEMGHLVTVQNLLHLLGGPLNLEREDFPFRSGLYPFHFRLEPLTKDALAKYVFAEMPADLPDNPEIEEIRRRANAANDHAPLNHVGELFARLLELIRALPVGMFLAETVGYQAEESDWAYPGMIVRVMRSREEALRALEAIAVQGEGMSMGQGTANSHYERFLSIYRDFPELTPIGHRLAQCRTTRIPNRLMSRWKAQWSVTPRTVLARRKWRTAIFRTPSPTCGRICSIIAIACCWPT